MLKILAGIILCSNAFFAIPLYSEATYILWLVATDITSYICIVWAMPSVSNPVVLCTA